MRKTVKVLAVVFTVIFFASSVFARNYKYDLGSIQKHSKRRIEVIERKLEEQKRIEEQAKKEKEIQGVFDQAERLHRQGRLEEAKELYDKAYQLSDDRSMGAFVKLVNKEIAEQERKKRKEERARKKKERKNKKLYQK